MCIRDSINAEYMGRERILAQWRGVDLSPYEKILTRPAKSSESLVKGVLAGLRIEQRQSETEILAVWQRLIAPDVAAHAQPSGLRNGTLFVSVDSSVWLDEIVRYRRKEILDRLQHSFGRKLIQKISYRDG
eukprot:TRINITY_DN20864_c0_g1_i1.p3 TRINITY_DN20864_c0_g1~~TRINITY_DN20864_c0_g1_i1.p3  ORF type:complete len:141 (+),score=10.42 TRINITY_DN20864_c0_g1_i1:32-424(+)